MEEKTVRTDHQKGKAFLKNAKAIVSFTPVARNITSTSGVPAAKAADGADPANAGYKNEFATKWSPWGANNNLPQDIIDLVGKCGVASGAILWNIAEIYGQGIMPCRIRYEGKREIIEPVDFSEIPEIEDFFLASDIKDDYALEATTDLVWFFNFFPYVILNKGRNKINKLYLNEATYSRFSVMNPETKVVDLVGVCADWLNPGANNTIEIPLLSEYDTLNDLRSRKSGYRFAIKAGYPTPGRSYYQKTYWDSVREAGWIDIAISVPKHLKAAFLNAMNIKYHIRIPDEHWKVKFKDWESKTEEQQLKLIDDELDLMEEILAGEDGADKAFISHFRVDNNTGKEIPGWVIEPIQDFVKQGKYIPEASAANNEILFAMLRHPDVTGSGADTKSGASRGNSGSNTREADLIKKALLGSFRDRITKPLYLVKRFNGWDKSIHFRMRDTVLTTLDSNPAGAETTIA